MAHIPSNRSAALAGAWCVLGMVPLEHWLNPQSLGTLRYDLAFIASALLFLFVPGFMFVVGRGPADATPDQRRLWAWSREMRLRMASWLLGAVGLGIPWSLIWSYLILGAHAGGTS